jgi:hypothetical protein
VQALEVGDFRLVAGLDQRLEPAVTSALTPPHSTACSPNRSVSVSSAKVVSMTPARVQPRPLAYESAMARAVPGRVGVHGHQGRRSGVLEEDLSHAVPRRFRRDHGDVHASGA